MGWSSEDIDNGVILHFAYKDKPWKKDNELHQLWKDNLNMAENIGNESMRINRRLGLVKSKVLTLRQKRIRKNMPTD